MKQTLLILALITSTIQTFAQSPRIKLNQITKDTVKGSVLISSPSDSGMVYSRDFYIAYGLTDTVLILYGDTLAATSGIISSVLSDGVTITGNGTSGNELKVDTSLVSTIQGLVDTLTARGYLTANETITLSGDVTGSGNTAITATVVDDSHNHIISNVDFLQDSLDAKANDSDLANYVTIASTQTITGAKTFTNTFTQSGGDANFDSGTLFVDESANRVGIGTTFPNAKIQVIANVSGWTTWIENQGTGGGNSGLIVTAGNNSGDNTILLRKKDGTETFAVKGTGNVGIGTSTPSYPLEMGSGAHVTTGGVWTDASDIKLKENINYYYPYGLNEIVNLKPTVFDYINGEKNSLGFIAQDVFEIIPEAISSTIDENGNETMGIKMVSITATLVKALQQQQSEIEQLKTLITDLTNRLIILENK